MDETISLKVLEDLSQYVWWRLDIKTLRFKVSDLFYETLGYRDSLVIREWDEFTKLLVSEDVQAFKDALELHLSEGIPFDVRIRFLLPNGNSEYFDLKGIALRDENGVGQEVFGQLLSGEGGENVATLESALATHQRMLIHSSKMSALGEMASGLAHEVNTPLAVIQAKANLLHKQLKISETIDNSKFSEELDKIIRNVARISKIIQGLRTFSRSSDNDSPQKVKFSSILEDTLELCNERLSKLNIRMMTAVPPDISVYCRPAQISQVLLNLLNNARDAIEFLEEKWIEVAIEEQEDGVRISVTDSGHGIPSEIANQIMKPFFTTKEVGKGTGIGLSISKSLIEENQGTFSLDPSCSHTRFIIKLPKGK